MRHEWFTACAEAFCPPSQLSIRIVRTDGRMTAVAPLVARSVFGMKRLELLGADILNEPAGFLYSDDESLDVLLDSILLSRTPILFNGLASDSPEVRKIRERQQSRYSISRSSSFASPWIPISSSWELYYSRISKDWRSAFRRSLRRAEQFGPVRFEIVSPNSDELAALLPVIFQVEAASWKKRLGTALQHHESLNRFFCSYTRSIAPLGKLRLAYLWIAETPVAVQLLVECANRLWVLKVGYNESYAKCSPGITLMNKIIQHAFEMRYEAIELLGRDEQWLNIWPHDLHRYENILQFPISPAAVIGRGLEVSNSTIRKFQTIIVKRHSGTGLLSHLWKVLGRIYPINALSPLLFILQDLSV
jgi:CelD/BcsL family acetyltransferase involved in cellulose biosynthesis